MDEETVFKEKFILTLMNLRGMQLNKINTDVVLECDGGNVEVHKCILMAASPYFFKMFTIDTMQANDKKVQFKDVSVAAMQIAVDSFYGEIPPNLKNDFELLKEVLAISYLFEDVFLASFIMRSILYFLTPDNYVDIWNLAIKFDSHLGKQHVMQFILKNLPKVLPGENLVNVTVSQMKDFVTFATNSASSCDKIMQLVITWTKCLPEERMQVIVTLVELMDKNKLSNEYIQKLLDSEEVVKFSTELTKILTDHAMSRLVSYQKNIHIQFYGLPDKFNDKTLAQTYCLREKEWYMTRAIQLPTYIATNWIPLMSIKGDLYYFAIANDKRFISYKQKARQVHFGPTVVAECCISGGVVDGNNMYIWSCKNVIQYQVDSTTWNPLTPIKEGNPRQLLAMNGNLFFHLAAPPCIMWYNFVKNDWDLKTHLSEDSEIVSIKCKCFNFDCKGKLYFIQNGNQLLSYEPETNEWQAKSMPELECKLPICMNCDESFILFSDRHNLNTFYLYYPVTNQWHCFHNTYFAWQDNFETCDLCLKS